MGASRKHDIPSVMLLDYWWDVGGREQIMNK